ncbi:MAG: hypothetical protein P8J87_10310 [Verrucomicrobiales bacterium]|nr:hypothetical protein [Verrucomicrobiales bacterium]
MKRLFVLLVIVGVTGIFGTGCLERRSGKVAAQAVEVVEEPAEGAVLVVEEDADVAAAISAAKAKRKAAFDPEQPITLGLGLKVDGEVIVEWKEGLNYAVTSEGSANGEAGATVQAKLGNGFDKFDLTLDLVVKVAGGEKLVVSGTYETTVPFLVTVLGSGETSDKVEGLSGEVGSGPFEYEGAVPVFFEVLGQ